MRTATPLPSACQKLPQPGMSMALGGQALLLCGLRFSDPPQLERLSPRQSRGTCCKSKPARATSVSFCWGFLQRMNLEGYRGTTKLFMGDAYSGFLKETGFKKTLSFAKYILNQKARVVRLNHDFQLAHPCIFPPYGFMLLCGIGTAHVLCPWPLARKAAHARKQPGPTQINPTFCIWNQMGIAKLSP